MLRFYYIKHVLKAQLRTLEKNHNSTLLQLCGELLSSFRIELLLSKVSCRKRNIRLWYVEKDFPNLVCNQMQAEWAFCQIRKIVGGACAGNAVNVSRPPRVSDPDMHHDTCVTHMSWCLPGSLTSGFLLSWWRGKASWHSRCMRNLQFCVSGNRSMVKCETTNKIQRFQLLLYLLNYSCFIKVKP